MPEPGIIGIQFCAAFSSCRIPHVAVSFWVWFVELPFSVLVFRQLIELRTIAHDVLFLTYMFIEKDGSGKDSVSWQLLVSRQRTLCIFFRKVCECSLFAAYHVGTGCHKPSDCRSFSNSAGNWRECSVTQQQQEYTWLVKAFKVLSFLILQTRLRYHCPFGI